MKILPIPWPQICYIYPTILFIGVLINSLLPNETLQSHKSNYYVLNSKNIFNQVMAYNGNKVWSILFILLSVIQIRLQSTNINLLPRHVDSAASKRRHVNSLIKQYVIKFVLKNVLLAFLFLIIDSLFILTGGECNLIEDIWSAEHCKAKGGRWEGGFDISGHFCFLINISLILWSELSLLNKVLEDREETFTKIDKWMEGVIVIILGCLYLWMGILFVTAVYYHTLLEKILGCILGFVCPIVMYYFIPNNVKLKQTLYK
ncbi:Yft2p NDAI_0C04310 [Naumovozyma dairenensis CBS 421]|uniref:Acyl-coenzyme A diphosphatase YFT2 n=1 Tax=Naumovozyma dairenensis (strain ATCC 10597 / BCRC 20456 / CBS 421 / NBRC 0211 / NRRL Y-12639) TaxID=1071378 RepID=G0W8I0_NAUDC|nr:hypothetical protein NDAI_0C04310 [Naumovozyma dairenensis CBS 421]CCD24091.1 hypothetical protein NDAI_0C04310 [Naumovozyma dairenensis CBS 421]